LGQHERPSRTLQIPPLRPVRLKGGTLWDPLGKKNPTKSRLHRLCRVRQGLRAQSHPRRNRGSLGNLSREPLHRGRIRCHVPEVPTNPRHFQHGRAVTPVLFGVAGEWRTRVATRAVASERSEYSIDKGQSEDGFSMGGCEEVGSRYPGI